MSSSSWIARNQVGKKRGVAIVTGPFYPRVVPGQNKTNRVNVKASDRQAFYHHEAVRMSEQYLNEINGAEGADVCEMHNKLDKVGKVIHTWLDDNRVLWGACAIPLNKRGQKVVADIDAGKLRGFSVSYGVNFADSDGTEIASKDFKEVSLVDDPFFDGMNIGVTVSCSSSKSEDDIVPLLMATITDQTTAAAAAAAGGTGQQQGNSTAAPASAPASASQDKSTVVNDLSSELAKQVAFLKADAEAKAKALEEEKRRAAFYQKREEERQRPRLNALIEHEKAKNGGKDLDPTTLAQWEAMFMYPEGQQQAEYLIQTMEREKKLMEDNQRLQQEIAAAKKEKEDIAAQKAQAEAAAKASQEAMINASKTLRHTFNGVHEDKAHAPATPAAPSVELNAGASSASDTFRNLLRLKPTDVDAAILRAKGFAPNSVELNASRGAGAAQVDPQQAALDAYLGRAPSQRQVQEYKQSVMEMPRRVTGEMYQPTLNDKGEPAYRYSASQTNPAFYEFLTRMNPMANDRCAEYLPGLKMSVTDVQLK